jgi:uncharacterized protein YhaN
MKVKDIQVDGFGVWSGLAVDSIPETMTLFYGPNEAGKTTLMQFLRAMFYGFTPERRGRYLPPVHGGTPGGAIRVTGPGGGYEIRRHAQLTDNGVVGQLSVTGQDGLSQGQHRLGMLLGQIDEPIFTNVFAIGIRELQELSTLDDTSAADELYKLSSGLDRVSLVDVLRTLRGGRKNLIGKNKADEDEAAVLASLVARRERLRDEVEQLTRNGRRWSELASQRRGQDSEIEQLTERIARWQAELRSVETASAVHDSWHERAEIGEQIERDDNRTQLPEDAPSQLVQIEALMEERKGKLEEIKAKRRELRDRAEELPLSRRLIDLQGKIEAASEQATWVEALQEQIARLDQQIEKAKAQLDADAEKLGLSDEERETLASRGRGELPDLSRQTLAALAGPAKEVKTHLFVLKQSREEARQHQLQAEKLGSKLTETLKNAQSSNLHEALRRQAEIISTLRSRIQLEQHLDKLRRHHRDLEKEALELATNEAYPLEQRILLFVPFLFGGMGTIYGMVHVLGWTWFFDEPDPTWGMTMVFVGMLCFFLWYFVRERGYTGTSLDLEDCERQIDSLRRQIREMETERDELDSRIPPGSGSLDARLRDAENLHTDLEAAMPAFHTQQAAVQAAKTSRNRATEAADGLKNARRAWSSTLARLGLSESMSPSSIRQLSENYETLQASRRRLDELEAERELRRRERATLAKRIDTLYLEAMGDGSDSGRQSAAVSAPQYAQTSGSQNSGSQSDRRGKPGAGNHPDANRDRDRDRDRDRSRDRDRGRDRFDDSGDAVSERPSGTPQNAGSLRSRRRTEPLEQLQELQEAVASQHHWIKRRHELRDQDMQLKKMHASCLRTIERCEQQRRSLWAKCGVATAEQFYEMVDVRTRLADMRIKMAELDKQIRGIIGAHVAYDDVAKELEGAGPADLQRRYDSLAKRIEETQARIAILRTSQGELSQEMKQLGEDDRLSVAHLELGCVERQIQSLVRRWQTLAMASSLLEDVCATFEKERQPETLREASSFLRQLTDGKYTRVWTPLGTNKLRVDSSEGQALDIDVLSRGTREAVFIALRLSLASAYARRGVMLPLVLDDVLVNFDRNRALYAAKTLKTFAEMGHQVLMFTCHKHIAEIFQEIDVQVRRLPSQGTPGRATIMQTEIVAPVVAPVAQAESVEEYYDEPERFVVESPAEEPEPVMEEIAEEIIPETIVVQIAPPKPKPKPRVVSTPLPVVVLPSAPQPVAEDPYDDEELFDEAELKEAAIGWNWYEKDGEEEWSEPEQVPAPAAGAEGIWQRSVSWIDPTQVTTPK